SVSGWKPSPPASGSAAWSAPSLDGYGLTRRASSSLYWLPLFLPAGDARARRAMEALERHFRESHPDYDPARSAELTEAGWVKASDPQAMLVWLRSAGELSERKGRLFACACVRAGVWHLLADERSRQAVEGAEGYADGEIGREELRRVSADAANADDGGDHA